MRALELDSKPPTKGMPNQWGHGSSTAFLTVLLLSECAGPPRPNLAVRFSKDDGLDNALRSDSASALDGARPALDSLEALPSEVYWADLPKKERIKWMIEEELAVGHADASSRDGGCV